MLQNTLISDELNIEKKPTLFVPYISLSAMGNMAFTIVDQVMISSTLMMITYHQVKRENFLPCYLIKHKR